MKRIITVILIVLMSVTFAGSYVGLVPNLHAADKLSNPLYDAEKDYAEWDCIYFGRYPQNSENEDDLQPIKWRVLSVDGNDVMLMSDKSILASEFVTFPFYGGGLWKGSQLLSNLINFAKTAFTQEEYDSVLYTTVKNEKNPVYTEYGNDADTLEHIYVLSYSEAFNTKYGFCEDPSKASKTRQAIVTPYADSKGKVSSSWWLRTAGDIEGAAMNVMPDGAINVEGAYIINDQPFRKKKYLGVRPVLHLDISNTDIWSYAGRVTSEDEPEAVNEPTASAKPTERPEATERPKTTERPISSTIPTEQPLMPSPNVKQINKAKIRKKTKILIKKGKKYKLPLKNRKKYKYKSSNKKVVTVTKKGVIKAVKIGKGTVKAKKGNKSYTFKIRVY